jgi:hypothetical protein
MSTTSKLGFAIGLALALAACGGDDDDDDTAGPDAAGPPDAAPVPDATPPGPGILVQGSLVVDNAINAETNANHRVNISVRVTRDGAPVTNAIIRVEPPGAFQTFLAGDALDPSLYTGNYMNYTLPQTRIEITAGTDAVPQHVLLGQELFKITEPGPGSVLTAGAEVAVAWTRPGVAADSLVVKLEGDGAYDSGAMADAAAFTIPAGNVTADGAIHVARCRRNDALPGDVAPGTYLDFCVDSRLAFTVAP